MIRMGFFDVARRYTAENTGCERSQRQFTRRAVARPLQVRREALARRPRVVDHRKAYVTGKAYPRSGNLAEGAGPMRRRRMTPSFCP